jgi:hypothetical protein
MLLTVDEMGITIGRGRRALATTEWPGSNVRVCETVEEPDTPEGGKWDSVRIGEWLQDKVIHGSYEGGHTSLVNLEDVIKLVYAILAEQKE